MLANITDYKEKITLIRDSGIQFLDFALTPLLRKERAGEFVRQSANGPLLRLEYNERDDNYLLPAAAGTPRKVEKPEYSVPLDRSFKLLDGLWLPLPFFRFNPPRTFSTGPINWARVQILTLDTPDQEGHTHRVSMAFDTKIYPDRTNTQYLAPSESDIKSGVGFALAFRSNELGDFLDLSWVDGWLREVFTEQAATRLRMHEEDIELALCEFEYQAHYLNLLDILGRLLTVPEIQINAISQQEPAIQVDLILDVGNSRTCGILVEDHPGEEKGLTQLYELQLRDLNEPHYVYNEPFESRIEFAQAEFGKQDFSVKSGRNDAFMWPTIVRVGNEASRMGAQRIGTEGSTGVSSPKRYLWDEEPYTLGWRFNRAFVKSDHEPLATAAPLTYLLNDIGQPLYSLPIDERMPVFSPNYSRSSLMTFMLCEVLTQALMQINSAAQRLKMNHARAARVLRTIILTVPPAMPKPEREIFRQRMHQAIALVWKAMGWHPADDDMVTEDDKSKSTVPVPNIHVEWDEATCGQLVYLFNETQVNYGGHTEEFFASMARPDKVLSDLEPAGKTLRIASIDIGGGTTDLVITQYALDGQGSNVQIMPYQLFREGFKVAGDDILLDVIQLYVLPALRTALKQAGVAVPEALMSRLFGSEGREAQQQVMRQQLTLQIFSPIGLSILKAYESYDPLDTGAQINTTFGALLLQQPTAKVLDYINAEVRRDLLPTTSTFDILQVPLNIALVKLHAEFFSDRMNITQSIRALCEVLYHYSCDVLLLTGRPSRLPGIQALFKQLQPLPPARILPLHGYHTGGWYPFNKLGCIDDPKSTAAVGAMLCLLALNLRLQNFFFIASGLRPYSTVRHLGMLDRHNAVTDDNVYYRDIDMDNDDDELDAEGGFEMRGTLRLGFRQLDNERWPASPLYTLSIAGGDRSANLAADVAAGQVLRVQLRLARKENGRDGRPERFEIADVTRVGGASVSRHALCLKLNTLADASLGETHYWLDSGSVLSK
ncbi:virulence factor SrfB [Acerihabitans sp. TG2]|uniref:virulence factor SrfB n=1 Tax=Acerihabitans sp. TG2 TaxID=3096008 RepID=UPI002B2342F1|nr:virulence factor SrfB [Acerihabitans sp. TG2]MEA9391535.1 virulence factor SrfB [Acerihabitans sp. TG2]